MIGNTWSRNRYHFNVCFDDVRFKKYVIQIRFSFDVCIAEQKWSGRGICYLYMFHQMKAGMCSIKLPRRFGPISPIWEKGDRHKKPFREKGERLKKAKKNYGV